MPSFSLKVNGLTLLFLDSVSCQSKRQKEIFFLNMWLKDERILPTKSGQTASFSEACHVTTLGDDHLIDVK